MNKLFTPNYLNIRKIWSYLGFLEKSVKDMETQIENIDEAIQISGADKYYRHSQGVAADTWLINHPLNKFPSVTITDTAGTVVMGEVKYIDNYNIQVKFSGAFSGFADLN